MGRRAVRITAGVAALALVAGGVWYLNGDAPERRLVEDYLAAWERNDVKAMKALVAAPPAGFDRWHRDSAIGRADYEAGDLREKDGGYEARFTARVALAEGADWTYEGRLRLVESDGSWKVRWSPAAIHPDLREGRALRLRRSWPERAAVTAADGTRIDTEDTYGSVKQLVGAVAPATAEDVKRLGAPYRAGDPVGTDGLQRTFERRLAGRPGLRVELTEGGRTLSTLARVGGAPGKALRTSVDLAAQKAGADALRDEKRNASLVAVKASTGEIKAVVNKPGGFNRALMGHYPPGSTFKVVTASALVADGLSPATRVACPARQTIGGFEFHNAGYKDYGTLPLRDAFAHSCNTTFGDLGVERLGEKRLREVAESFGFGSPLNPGVPAVRARFPSTGSETELASAAFGQGKVLASPLNMATVAAAIAGGAWRPPRLVDAALLPGGEVRKLEPGIVRALRQLMPAVVSDGTANAVDFPAGVGGKTGTAEFGEGEEPPAHSWFIGYKGDLAFAVIVEGAGEGAAAAAPIAAEFLRGLS
ncbi:penicillin-binding transpeptidase domain-containing protein [Bailinhaonella thermotolerans]|uniref:Cell division protein FtsI n=1 Tax=Bailinhaonella thermotolerans TaxID=1070861 RepID=A0A3A4BIA7_9ACTN|nr:penicillin-binding transpeptidase domain-containing protein [Bailinhaonella thermotolerans]RJL34562.1 cell division protein FtsI [Bailinhaonella thermotolerans]